MNQKDESSAWKAIAVFLGLLLVVGVIAVLAIGWNNNDNTQTTLSAEQVREIVHEEVATSATNSSSTSSGSTDEISDPSSNAGSPTGFEIHEQETRFVRAGLCVEGDMRIGGPHGFRLFDDDEVTGLVTCFNEGANVYAHWGAWVSDATANDMQADELRSGCGLAEGCHKVIIKYWPEDS